jgi:hypothetical protein
MALAPHVMIGAAREMTAVCILAEFVVPARAAGPG